MSSSNQRKKKQQRAEEEANDLDVEQGILDPFEVDDRKPPACIGLPSFKDQVRSVQPPESGSDMPSACGVPVFSAVGNNNNNNNCDPSLIPAVAAIVEPEQELLPRIDAKNTVGVHTDDPAALPMSPPRQHPHATSPTSFSSNSSNNNVVNEDGLGEGSNISGHKVTVQYRKHLIWAVVVTIAIVVAGAVAGVALNSSSESGNASTSSTTPVPPATAAPTTMHPAAGTQIPTAIATAPPSATDAYQDCIDSCNNDVVCTVKCQPNALKPSS